MSMHKTGSILVEVLLSVMIMSVSLTILIGGLMSGYRLTLLNNDYSQALMLFENQMTHVRYVSFKDLPSGSVSLSMADGKKCGLHFQTQTVLMNQNNDLKLLNTVLSWPSGQRTIRLPVATFFLKTRQELP